MPITNPFLYIWLQMPTHLPYHDVPQDWYEYYLEQADELAKLIISESDEDELNNELDTVARIFAMISNIDDNVGRVMKQLQDLEIADETLVIYLNDNGPNTRRYVGPFRGMKTEVYEGGIRSPLWFYWPSRLSAECRW
ncbi:MAG: sulfatase-like hydrolase/transferase [Balneolaceae bacterium]|nr:sulfatase-like hydrolase/transferase [Balneolaceae bacterium]